MVGKNANDKKKAVIFLALASVAAAIMLASLPQAFAGGGGGRSGISEACNEAVCHVNMTGLTFAPDTLKIRPNAVVVWTNTDKVVHTVTSGSLADKGALFDSGLSSPITGGGSWEHKFDTAGKFEYFCQFHPRMVGQVIVTGDPVLEFPQAAPLALVAGAAVASAIAGMWIKKSRKSGPA